VPTVYCTTSSADNDSFGTLELWVPRMPFSNKIYDCKI